MANFEALIRGALAAKGAGSPEERAVVYQSSRNALQKLIEGNRSITVESAVQEKRLLEESILRIEAEYQPGFEPEPPVETAVEAAVETVADTSYAQTHENTDLDDAPSLAEAIHPSDEPPVQPPVQPVAQPQDNDPFLEIQQVLGVTPEPLQDAQSDTLSQPVDMPPAQTPEADIVSAPQPQPQTEVAYQPEVRVEEYEPEPAVYADEPATLPSGFAKRRKSQRNWLWFILFLIILGLLAWIGYRAFLGAMDGSLFGLDNNSAQSSVQQDDESSYFTIVEPGDLTALIVSDRGRVEIVNEQGLEMIRILSIRDQADRDKAAQPILLRLKPGVIQEIRGKRVTVEIIARSGKSGSAQFATECQFGTQLGCGRKRFRVGVQPEAYVFAFTMERNRDINKDAFIAISTDITDKASITGEGDILDIVNVRLRTSKEGS